MGAIGEHEPDVVIGRGADITSQSAVEGALGFSHTNGFPPSPRGCDVMQVIGSANRRVEKSFAAA